MVAIWLLIQTPAVQNWLIDKVVSRLSKDLETKISIRHVDFSLFNKMNLEGVLVQDRQKDTILSAGAITVNITDWFFLKKNIELKYIGLRDAYIHLQRTDSVWRHQFLIDYFATPGAKKKKENTVNLALREVDLKNILVKQEDRWFGKDMTISLASLNTVSRNVDFSKKVIQVSSLNINQPYFAIRNYKGNEPEDTAPAAVPKPVVTDTSDLDINDNKWRILVSSLSLRNGTFKNDNDSRPLDPAAFDGRHIAFTRIYGDFKNIKWVMDTVTANIKLSTVERSGFEVKHLITDAKFTPNEMTFENLDIQTNDSHISNYFSMKYSSFDDMSDFEEKVNMEGRFNNTEVNSDDIAFFAPDLKTWKKQISVSGTIKGPVAALHGHGLDIRAGANTYFLGDASLTGLPQINGTFLDIKANEFKTIYSDAAAFIPSLKDIKSPDLRQLGTVLFSGNFTGFIRDFVTFGTIQTALGTVKADLNMKLPQNGSPVYSGTVSSAGFNAGKLLQDDNIGYVSLNSTLKGAGFKPGSGNIALDASVKYIDYKKYRYQDITVDGELNKKIFDGTLIVNDPNAHLNLNGLIDFSKENAAFNFIANIDTLNFRNINLLEDNIAIRGKINAQFNGKSIDDFLGSANISDAALTRDGFPLSFDSLSINSEITADGNKHLSIASNEFAADLLGTFNIRDLPNSVTAFLSKYYPSYIKKPSKAVPGQSFTFDIRTNNFDELATILDSSLFGFSNSRIKGSINTANNSLELDVNVPYFKFRQFDFSNVAIDAEGNYDSLTLYGSASNITITDSLKVQLATFNINAGNDVSKVSIYVGGNKAVDQSRLNATVNTYSNGVGIKFAPSSFMINGKTWSIEDNGALEFRKNYPAHGQLVLRESLQEVKIETTPSDIGGWNDVGVTLKNLNLGDIAPYFMPNNRLEGSVDAQVLIENPGPQMKISSQDFTGKAIRLDNDSIGDMNAVAIFDMPTKELTVNGKTLGTAEKSLAYNVHLYLKDAESQANNIIALKASHFDLKYIDRFLNSLFSDLSGDITGDFDIKGPLNSLTVAGKGKLHNAGLRVKFTQCYYKILDRDIELSENEINLNGIVLQDTITGNPVYLTGSILHSSFKDMFFDITVSTRKPGTSDRKNNQPVQVLNTSYADNKVFYGNVRATGSFVLIGPEDNTYMKIDAIASDDNDGTFTIASSNSRAGKMPDWLVEKKYGTEISDSAGHSKEASNVTYDLDITANPKVLMKFVMDDLTGDQIVGRGSGTLNIRSGSSEPLAIKGRLDIQEGNYNYTFKSFFPKPFEIIKGTENYISWTGDPLKANINIQAKYKAERVSFAPLAGVTIDNSYANTRENVYVYATLTGQLFKPDFKFELQLDPNSRYNNDFNVTNALQQIERSQTEVTRQVTYLIVFNSFASPETGVSNIGIGAAVNELTYNTISSLSGLFFNEINKKLNNALGSILGSNVSVVFSGSVYNRNVLGTSSTDFNINQANVNGALLVPLFKDRLVISLGSSLEVPLQSTLQQTVQFLPDVTAEWLLNPSGSIRLNLFYRENLDYLTTSNSGAARLKRTGGGISFKKEFNNLREVFINVRKRAERQANRESTAANNADSTQRVQPVTIEKKEDSLIPETVPQKEP
ncbi:MAG: hypothetical protein QM640_07405 [Niabella sp.]